MKPFYTLWLAGVAVVVAGCSPKTEPSVTGKPAAGNSPPAAVNSSAADKPTPASDPKAVLTLEGSGGSVAIGDTPAQAKKAFPPPKNAQIMDRAMNFAIFQREGWAWATEQPLQAFEVNLKDGKIVGIARTAAEPDAQKRKKEVEQVIQQIGPPTSKSEGKTAALYAWDVKPNARFLVVMEQGMLGSGPMVMTLIGNQDELKMLSYRVDDTETMVKQLDLGAEAMKKMDKKQGTP